MSPVLADSPPLFDEDHEAFRESVGTFLRREVLPHYPAWRRAGAFPRELLRAAGEYGFLGMRVPEAHGGVGVNDLRFGLVVGEEAARVGASDLALVLTTHNEVALPTLLRGLPEERHCEYFPGLASGELLATVVSGGICLKRDAGGAALTGSAPFVIARVDADLHVVVAQEDDRDVLALVERAAAGLSLTPADAPIGLLAAGLADVTMDAVPALVLDANAGELVIDRCLALGVTALAGARAALDTTVAYVLDRKAFGQPIAAFENTRQALAGVWGDLNAAEALVDGAVRERISGRLGEAKAAAVQLHCSALFDRAVDTGVQLHGGYGYILEYPIAHLYADARFWRLAGDGLREVIAASVLP
jgi:acyl-CoA dehydrogenase